jgi:hypothetical protein
MQTHLVEPPERRTQHEPGHVKNRALGRSQEGLFRTVGVVAGTERHTSQYEQ